MRAIAALLVIASPIAALAQTPPAGTVPPNARVITRDQFVQRATAAAGRRFDAIDTNHAGYVTMDQLRAWREAHRGQAMGQP